MPRVTVVKHARKDYPEHDIKKGDTYYWWKFKFGGKHFSKTPPKPQQLTQSEFTSQVYDFEDALGALVADDTIESQIEEIADNMDSLADEQEEKRSNMPDQLQDSDVGTMLEERGDAMREWAEELRGLDFDLESDTAEDLEEEAGTELGYDTSDEGLREEVLHKLGIDEEQIGVVVPVEGSPGVSEADVVDKIEELRRDLETEIKERAQEMADERKEEKIQEIVDEAQGTSYGGP